MLSIGISDDVHHPAHLLGSALDTCVRIQPATAHLRLGGHLGPISHVGLQQGDFEVSSRLLAVRFGINRVSQGVSSDNMAAVRAYEKAGFSIATREGEHDQHLRMECLIEA